MLKKIEFNLYENLHDYVDHFEPHSDEVITSDQGYVDVAQQIESMMLAGQLLQESRPNTRNMSFDYDDDDTAFTDYDDVAAVDRRGADIVDITRDAEILRDRVNQAYRTAIDKAKAEQSKADQTKVEVVANE